ncbi:MAG: metalloregulator ArsR/SmtB family transcription factor [Desulfobacterales bacterium]|jgi:ArsR family transcriptional regulator|nr:metalloregulator ArsR/SmtB family transcription factor [Desulfobacterales bacterium]
MEKRVLELKAELLKALAQPTRLRILELLRDGEKCICEIVPAINGEQSNVSRHISLMQKSHLVTTRKDGVKVMVKVTDREIFNILDRVSRVLKVQFEEQEKLFARI